MRIVVVNQYAVPPSEPGGTRHYALAAELAARGHEVVLITGNRNYSSGAILGPTGRLVPTAVPGVSFLRGEVPAYSGNGMARAWSMMAFAREAKRLAMEGLPWRPDIVVGSSPHPFGALAASTLARRFNAPFVLEIRDLWPESLVEGSRLGGWHPFIMLLRQVEWRLYRRADAIISLLEGAGGYLARFGVPAEVVAFVPNGVPLAAPSTGERTARDGPFVALYAGAHGHMNGLETLIRAGEILERQGYADRIRIRLVGDGPDKARLARLASAIAPKAVELLPAVRKSEMPGVLAAADTGILHLRASPVFRWGISPNKLFDYMMARLPVVLAVSVDDDPVRRSGGGLAIPPEDPRALADALIRLAELPREEREAMGARGRDYVAREHTYPVLAARLESAFLGAAQRWKARRTA